MPFYSKVLSSGTCSGWRCMLKVLSMNCHNILLHVGAASRRDYPGLRIGPEPTTDKFVAVCKGDMDQAFGLLDYLLHLGARLYSVQGHSGERIGCGQIHAFHTAQPLRLLSCMHFTDRPVEPSTCSRQKTSSFGQGNNFLTRFECAKLDSPVLNGMSLIDTVRPHRRQPAL